MLREEKRLAIRLRLAGGSYNEIRNQLLVSKSTLSSWLSDYPLTSKQISALTGRYKAKQIENYRLAVRKRNELRLSQIYKKEAKKLLPLSKRELLIAGLFLYLGEGGKRGNGSIIVSNTDPNIVKFVLYWYTKVLKIPKEKIRVSLQLYMDMDIQREMTFWSRSLGMPLINFWKPYIKKSHTMGIDHSGYKHGTCGLYHGNARLFEKIMMGTKVILDKTNL